MTVCSTALVRPPARHAEQMYQQLPACSHRLIADARGFSADLEACSYGAPARVDWKIDYECTHEHIDTLANTQENRIENNHGLDKHVECGQFISSPPHWFLPRSPAAWHPATTAPLGTPPHSHCHPKPARERTKGI